MHRRNLFREIAHGNESERIFLEQISQEEKVDPATGEAHYYKCSVDKNLKSFKITFPRDEECTRILGNAQYVKVIMPRKKDNYIVIKPYE